ncbi:MAG: D-serine ammonia-lyase [Rudaea sp.]
MSGGFGAHRLHPPSLAQAVSAKQPVFWSNPNWRTLSEAATDAALGLADVRDAEARWQRFGGLLEILFPELRASAGLIESQLYPVDAFRQALTDDGSSATGRWFVKADHELPVAGSIKARGGIYEVLVHAERLALGSGWIQAEDDPCVLATPRLRECFARHRVAVGSTGNLGLSIGIAAAALGFRATVHMSSDAKAWKKIRLRARGVEVVEHEGDFGAAVAAGREQTAHDAHAYFVDDENSRELFLGYSVAALRLRKQLADLRIEIDAGRPLCVYLPCGVGGAPGGITFGLRHLLGDHVHCFFAEPLASPCMLLRLAQTDDADVSVRDFGLDNRTAADGLAVARASQFVAPLMRPLVSGVFTVADDQLFEDLYRLERSEGLRIEPSAAAALRGPMRLRQALRDADCTPGRIRATDIEPATHVLWTTGGTFVPEEEYREFHERGRMLFHSVA